MCHSLTELMTSEESSDYLLSRPSQRTPWKLDQNFINMTKLRYSSIDPPALFLGWGCLCNLISSYRSQCLWPRTQWTQSWQESPGWAQRNETHLQNHAAWEIKRRKPQIYCPDKGDGRGVGRKGTGRPFTACCLIRTGPSGPPDMFCKRTAHSGQESAM